MSHVIATAGISGTDCLLSIDRSARSCSSKAQQVYPRRGGSQIFNDLGPPIMADRTLWHAPSETHVHDFYVLAGSTSVPPPHVRDATDVSLDRLVLSVPYSELFPSSLLSFKHRSAALPPFTSFCPSHPSGLYALVALTICPQTPCPSLLSHLTTRNSPRQLDFVSPYPLDSPPRSPRPRIYC